MLIAGSALTADVAPAQQAGISRTDLQRHDLGTPGREAVQVRVDFAAGATAAKHRHPGEEIVYVLAGSIEYRVDGREPVTLNAGDVLFIPAETFHSAKNVGSVLASELATYIVEKGKPLVVFATTPWSRTGPTQEIFCMTERSSGWTAIATYSAGYEADIALARLSSAGIDGVRRGNDTVGLFGPSFEGPTARGVDVLVPAEVANEARAVLAENADTA